VQADPEADWTRSQLLGDAQRCPSGGGWIGEREKERIALRVDLDATFRVTGAPNDVSVRAQLGGVRLGSYRVQEPGRTFDVGEGEGDATARKVAIHPSMLREAA
jgi:hypothetical protein